MYFHGHSVGGTNPSLLDAMAAKAPIAIHDNVFNDAIIKENVLRFDCAQDVFDIVSENLLPDEIQIEDNYVKIASEFTWEKIVNQYEYYFLAVT